MEKPRNLAIQEQHIPEEIKEQRKWICWKWEKKNGNWTKPPYNFINGSLAQSNNSNTWGFYQDAMKMAQTPEYDGVGFMISKDDPYCGVDWDDCRDPETGEIKDDILEKVLSFNSYTEISPSKKGLKTLIKGTLPGGGHHGKEIGVFNNTRYFCITGWIFKDCPSDINEAQEPLDSLCRNFWPEDYPQKPTQKEKPLYVSESDILQKALAEDAKFSRLWTGNISDYPSHSEADCALCTKLAFWFNKNDETIDRMFRQSGLMRDKWSKRQDYRTKTIKRGCVMVEEPYSPKVSRVSNGKRGKPIPPKYAEVSRSKQNGKQKVSRNLTAEVKIWVNEFPGIFTINELDRDLKLFERSDKNNRSKVLNELVKKGIIEKYGDLRGTYRSLDTSEDEIDFLNCDTTKIDFLLPFNLHNMVRLMPSNIIGIAGEPNSGKTAFLLATVLGNKTNTMYVDKKAGKHIRYFSSEMRGQEFQLRLKNVPIELEEWGTFMKAYSRTENFHDVIRPDDCNIIDFLEIHDEFYKVGGYMTKIFNRLRNGIALVALQKNTGSEFGLGGQRGLEKPRLYLSIANDAPNGHIIKIIKAKNFIGKNPNGYQLRFKIVEGWKLVKMTDWTKDTPGLQ